MTHAFISYRREKTEIVESLVADIERLPGHSAWIDIQQRGDRQWWDEVLEAIAKADGFIPGYDKAYDNSYICYRELDYALSLKKPLLPVLVDSLTSDDISPRRAERWNYLTYNSDNREIVFELSNRLFNIAPHKDFPNPLPELPAYPSQEVLEAWNLVHEGNLGDADSQLLFVERLNQLRDDGLTQSDLDFLVGTFRKRHALFERPAKNLTELGSKSNKQIRKDNQIDNRIEEGSKNKRTT